jgi:DNA-directed RNA polymerase specialized sigma24 family protein
MNPQRSPAEFSSTRWKKALASLCYTYWYPLYAFFRRSGRSEEDAISLIQSLFSKWLEAGRFPESDPDQGRLRSFLLASVHKYLLDDRPCRASGEREGGFFLQCDWSMAEARFCAEAAEDLSPDSLYQKKWAMALIDHCLENLEKEFLATNDLGLYQLLRPCLGFCPESANRYEEIARRTGLPVGVVKNKVLFLRERWNAILHEGVAETLNNPTEQEIREELMELLGHV